MKLTFAPAPELTQPSRNYPADYVYSYDRCVYRGVTILREYVNGVELPNFPYIVALGNCTQHFKTQRQCVLFINKYGK